MHDKFFLSIMCFNLDNIVFAMFKLIARSLICCFHLRFSSLFIRRYFTEFTGHSLFPMKFGFKRTFFPVLPGLNKSTSVLVTFRQFLFSNFI